MSDSHGSPSIPPEKVPAHVAIIMDGNGRWAQKRGYPRVFGHIRGSSRVKAVVREADRIGIRALTLFAFSTENWNRPDSEQIVLWKLLKKYLVREADELAAKNVRLRIIGEKDRLSPEIRTVLDPLIERLSSNTGLQLNFAVSYGARREIARAARAFAQDCAAGKRRPEEMNEGLFSEYLWTADLCELSDVDLVIRTSGELRISNFLLWQAAYAEFVFSEICWPDFESRHLVWAIEEYAQRERRFGGLGQAPQVVGGMKGGVRA